MQKSNHVAIFKMAKEMLMTGELFKKYYSRLAKEGFLKALVCGLIIGFSLLLISAAVFWLADIERFWLCIVLWAVATAVATPIFYYTAFRPTIKAIAKRVDELGLEERILTMTELEKDDSYIAMRQREDAKAALKTIDAKRLKFAISIPLIVSLSVVAVFGSGMTTVAALSEYGVIKKGSDVIDDIIQPAPKTFTIEYRVQGEGTILIEGQTNEEIGDSPNGGQDDEQQNNQNSQDNQTSDNSSNGSADGQGSQTGQSDSQSGETSDQENDKKNKWSQSVKEGENSKGVLAVPAKNWVFVRWSDGLENPYRTENDVSKNMTLTAIFEAMDEVTDNGVEEDSDDADDLPSDSEGDPTPPSEGEEQGSNSTAEQNQVIDGNTYYGGSTFENAYQEAQEEMEENGEIPDELKDIIEDYYNSIKK